MLGGSAISPGPAQHSTGERAGEHDSDGATATPAPSRARLAIVTHGFFPSVGGSERYHEFTARAMVGVAEVRVFTSDLNLRFAEAVSGENRSARGPDHTGLVVEYLPSVSLANEKWVSGRKLWNRLRAFRPDVVWTNQPSPTGAMGALFALVTSTPWIATYHADIAGRPAWHRMYQRLEYRLLRHADAVLVTSEHYRRKLVTRGVEDRRITAVPTGPYLGGGHLPDVGRTVREEVVTPG
ncbi:MAG: glycosyltransferase family 4 protein, partial [Thermoplasmata archaeon]|nr:glycosyltransferase family 4 protein [Thermoplasmata archaeon]